MNHGNQAMHFDESRLCLWKIFISFIFRSNCVSAKWNRAKSHTRILFTCLFTQYARTCARATQCKHMLPLTRSLSLASLSKKINKNRMRCNENKESRFITPSMMKCFLRLFTCSLFRKAMKCNANDDLPSPPTHSHSTTMNNHFFRCKSAFRSFSMRFFFGWLTAKHVHCIQHLIN